MNIITIMIKSSELLKQYRRDKKISQMQLAVLLDTNQGNISKWESGQTTPCENMVFKIQSLAKKELPNT